ncbi:hypothetical protein RJ640_024372 [Escallonia rubra]|uniref:Uncharacterized protein n=1 Tax=Escallonia rubra TaxID=112253 RepID=A0AA88RJ42_9ASTE|nr:hypothetical protein RJ640_024372 [Escallonia rubra]
MNAKHTSTWSDFESSDEDNEKNEQANVCFMENDDVCLKAKSNKTSSDSEADNCPESDPLSPSIILIRSAPNYLYRSPSRTRPRRRHLQGNIGGAGGAEIAAEEAEEW